MSILKKENKDLFLDINNMFEVSVLCAFDELKDKIEQTYSKDILSAIQYAGDYEYHEFLNGEKCRIRFLLLDDYNVIHEDGVLDRLEWNIRVHLEYLGFSVNYDDSCTLIARIKTDGAREFVSDLLSETLKRLLKE